MSIFITDSGYSIGSGIYGHDYRQGKSKELRKRKKAQRRAQKKGRRNSHV